MSLPTGMPFAEMYERFLVDSLFRPFAAQLLDCVQPAANDSLLDVACGTGIVARLARKRVGAILQIVGVDSAAGMLQVARSIDRTIEWREGNAMKLPVPDNEQFSIVTCHQGLQFFPKKSAALGEMRRVLQPGADVVIATWRPLAEIPFFREVDEVAQKELGPFTDSRHSFGDSDEIEAQFVRAGFHAPDIKTFARDVNLTDGPVFARLNTLAIAGMSPKAKTMNDQERSDTIDRVTEKTLHVIARYSKGETFSFSLATNIAVAH
jgi:ubiquinone/menaquinone biosynthesis C-methylase UbiE